MTRIYNPEDGIWTIDQSDDIAVSEHTMTKVSSSFGLGDKVNSLRNHLLIPGVVAAPSPLGQLGALAVEIGLMVYRHLLLSKQAVFKPNLLIGAQRRIMVWHNADNEETDAAILRTCRTVYMEALPLLYGWNWFYFNGPGDIEQFGHLDLQTSAPISAIAKPLFGLKVEPYGRLAMLRCLLLRLSPPHGHVMYRSIDTSREDIWSYWLAFFHPRNELSSCVGFPALDHLQLDFTEWQLGIDNTSQLRVVPFLKKLRVPDGLSSLCLIGLQRQQNLLDFKYGFCKKGGIFMAKRAERGNTIVVVPNTIVVDDGLELVSNGVRAIIQQDGKPSWGNLSGS